MQYILIIIIIKENNRQCNSPNYTALEVHENNVY